MLLNYSMKQIVGRYEHAVLPGVSFGAISCVEGKFLHYTAATEEAKCDELKVHLPSEIMLRLSNRRTDPV